MEIIHESIDYGKFEQMPFNRNVIKVKALEESMKKYGFLSPHPLHVVKNGSGKFKIKDGHHRFVVAQKLKIPVKYVVCDCAISMYELVKTTRNWSLQDYLDSYCRQGLSEYLLVKDYCDQTGLPINLAIAILAGHTAGTGNAQYVFKDGSYKVLKNTTLQHDVKEYVLLLKNIGVDFYNNSYLVNALSKIALVQEVSKHRMIAKIKKNVSLITKKATSDQYLELLDDIYNRSSRDKFPLKFKVEETMKQRKTSGLQCNKNKNKH